MKKTRHHRTEHGTAASYVVGYALSLLLTLIPFYVVVSEKAAGNKLVGIILGFAVAQMFVQIFFFLHLGRGPKPLYNVAFFVATVGIIAITIGGTLFIMNNLYHNMSPKEITLRVAQEENIAQVGGTETGACTENKESHIVTIGAGIVTPAHIQAQRCDTLTFINKDGQQRMMAFGSHPNHDGYGGIYEVVVDAGDSETITLNEPGNYMFHDHLEPGVSGHFTVEP